MNKMIERVATAIQAELRRQNKLYPFPPEEPDPTKLMMPTGECADLPAVVRAAIEALREPTPEMTKAVHDECFPGEPVPYHEAWQLMIDAALTSSKP